MSRPAPGHTGDCAHLPWGSVRWSLARGMRLVVITHEGPPHSQYVALLSGAPVVVTREQLEGFISEGDRETRGLPDVSTSERWLLEGDSTLTPVTS